MFSPVVQVAWFWRNSIEKKMQSTGDVATYIACSSSELPGRLRSGTLNDQLLFVLFCFVFQRESILTS